ncbi:hypothetical protein BKA62DRAFT_633175 [Auriculariales sp. MPI-PUGE-AT-0066]|nr:hypothetical protein BKA62DRAFT_633175 [Auriculariales sp. MPI-PUGE-AT-0066]
MAVSTFLRWALVALSVCTAYDAWRAVTLVSAEPGLQAHFGEPQIYTDSKHTSPSSITFSIAKHSAQSLELTKITPESLLRHSAEGVYSNDFKRLFSSSLGGPETLVLGHIPARNGLVDTILDAWNHHHALIIRPDDIWLAIVTQFSFFVNGNAEELRETFVSHEGKEDMEVFVDPTRDLFNGADLAPLFADELEKRVKDPSLRKWLIPSFTTTTDNDRVVGGAVLMGAMKMYYSYTAYTMCGIPRVTIQGTRADWEEILHRVHKLTEYGTSTTIWHKKLVPIIRRFISTYDDPTLELAETRWFWHNMVQHKSQGSGVTFISGWITAFCQFDDKGKLITGSHESPVTMMDGITYPRLDIGQIPHGYVSVNITLNDNGAESPQMVAGLVGTKVTSSGDIKLSWTGKHDTFAPGVNWWLFEKFSDKEKASRPPPSEMNWSTKKESLGFRARDRHISHDRHPEMEYH